MTECPLCSLSEAHQAIKGPDTRFYRMCSNCKLIFVESRCHLKGDDEKLRYMSHHNGIEHAGYVRFLNQALNAALPYLPKNGDGLDFGCGPSPTLSQLLIPHGYNCTNYDPFFYPQMPNKVFDFIFATECFEHFFTPSKDIKQIYSLLKSGGVLIIMTELWSSLEAFQSWYYARDNTHVSFFHEATFQFMASVFGFELLRNQNLRVIIMRKI